MAKLTAPQTYKIVNYLLAHPETSQVEISRKMGVSRDLVNHVVQDLEAPGIVAQEAREHLQLKDPLRLLEALSIQRPLSKLTFGEMRTEESDVSRVERTIEDKAKHQRENRGYAFTAFSALSKYIEYYIYYPTVHVYSAKPLELLKGLIQGRGDVAVLVLKPDSELILHNARRSHEATLVEPIQVVIDLFCLGGAGRDGAMKLYHDMIEIASKSEKKVSISKGII